MSRKIIAFLCAVCVVGGLVFAGLSLHKSSKDSDNSDEDAFARVESTRDGRNFCFEGLRPQDEPDKLTLENCGDEPLRLIINLDKNDRRKAKVYQPNESRTIELKKPKLTVFVDARTLKGKPLGMSISLTPQS